MSTHRFEGTATTSVDRAGSYGPVVNPIGFTATFDSQGNWTVKPEDFSGAAPADGNGASSEDKVSLAETAQGSSSKAAKAATLKAKFNVLKDGTQAVMKIDFATDVSWKFPGGPRKNEQVSSAPIDIQSGRIKLAGKGKINAKALPLFKFAAFTVIEGVFTPNPWA